MDSENIIDVEKEDSVISDSPPAKSSETTLTVSVLQDNSSEHPCYNVLLTRRAAVKNKAYRTYMMKEVINQSVKMYLPYSMMKELQFLHWHHKTSAFVAKPRHWTNKKFAEAICNFDTILERSQNVSDTMIVKYPPAITHFINYMNEIKTEAEILANENIRSTKGRIGSQKGSTRIQDNVDMKSLQDNSFDMNCCAACKHKYIIPIGIDVVEITKHNTMVDKNHLAKMKVWSNTPTKKRGVKPRPDKVLSQHLACLCCKMNCIDRRDGNGCRKCEAACANAIEQGSDVRPFLDANFVCKCEICVCECSVVYYRHEAKKMARQARIDANKKNATLSQPKLNAFFGFGSLLKK